MPNVLLAGKIESKITDDWFSAITLLPTASDNYCTSFEPELYSF